MKEKMDKLVQVADSIEQGVNSAIDRWRDLPGANDKIPPFRRCLVD